MEVNRYAGFWNAVAVATVTAAAKVGDSPMLASGFWLALNHAATSHWAANSAIKPEEWRFQIGFKLFPQWLAGQCAVALTVAQNCYNIFSSRCFQPSNLSVNAVIFRGGAHLGAICRAAWCWSPPRRNTVFMCCSLWPAAACYCRCPYLARLFASAPHVRIVCAEFSAQFMQMFPFLEDAPVNVSDLQSPGDWRYSICVQIISQESGMSNIFTCPQIF